MLLGQQKVIFIGRIFTRKSLSFSTIDTKEILSFTSLWFGHLRYSQKVWSEWEVRKHIQSEVRWVGGECSSTCELQVSGGGVDAEVPICAASLHPEFLLWCLDDKAQTTKFYWPWQTVSSSSTCHLKSTHTFLCYSSRKGTISSLDNLNHILSLRLC